MSGVWSTIILEAYCTYGWASKKKWEGRIIDSKDGKLVFGRRVVTKNEGYIPSSKRPAWCVKSNKKRIPHYGCLAGTNPDIIKQLPASEAGPGTPAGVQCPFLAFCNAERDAYKMHYEAERRKIKGKTGGRRRRART